MIILRQIVILILFHVNVSPVFSQGSYTLDLSPPADKIKLDQFYIDKVTDDRKDKQSTGNVLDGTVMKPVKFKNSLGADLLSMISGTVVQDTSTVPLTLSVEKFQLTETGNVEKHTAGFNFIFKFYRENNGKQYLIYETNGKPTLEMRGPFPKAHEKTITQSISRVLTSFNDWINTNPDIPPLAKYVKVSIQKDPRYLRHMSKDTLQWTPELKLTWNDFKGRPPAYSFSAQSNCAFTYTARPKVSSNVLNLDVSLIACFASTTSWVKPDEKRTALLKHEQLHFDICELNIRRLRKSVLEYKFDPFEYETQMRLLFDSAWNAYQDEQNLYDAETGHGVKEKEQNDWEMKIQKSLEESSDMNFAPAN